jgi:hypothetical protein
MHHEKIQARIGVHIERLVRAGLVSRTADQRLQATPGQQAATL